VPRRTLAGRWPTRRRVQHQHRLHENHFQRWQPEERTIKKRGWPDNIPLQVYRNRHRLAAAKNRICRRAQAGRITVDRWLIRNQAQLQLRAESIRKRSRISTGRVLSIDNQFTDMTESLEQFEDISVAFREVSYTLEQLNQLRECVREFEGKLCWALYHFFNGKSPSVDDVLFWLRFAEEIKVDNGWVEKKWARPSKHGHTEFQIVTKKS
jgi:hypothetical protein